jgi:hypothetical protein
MFYYTLDKSIKSPWSTAPEGYHENAIHAWHLCPKKYFGVRKNSSDGRHGSSKCQGMYVSKQDLISHNL